ncbi:hypothetical protein [Streptomyces sp. NPDC060027]|uniref:hypothetical protein n=1 Tax=Streptomyces sp. NPDC060027 TaxID=3347040 RepID=UPI00368EF851
MGHDGRVVEVDMGGGIACQECGRLLFRPDLSRGVRGTLLLALSTALNIAITAGLLARRSGAGIPQAVLTGAGAAATSLGVYFAAVAAYT